MRGALAAVLALLAGGVQAQEGPIHAPCLAVHPQPTDYVAAFQAEGWKFREAGPGREAALPALAFSRLLATQLPPRPETPAELFELRARAAEPGQLRQYATSLIFTRGEAVAALDFDPLMNGTTMVCTFVAPHLPELDGVEMHAPQIGDRPLAAEFAVPEAAVPAGASNVTVNVWRFRSDVEPPAPFAGEEALSVSLDRIEPRFVVPQVHGLLRAFGADERTESLTPPEEGQE